MKFLRDRVDSLAPHFNKGGKLEKFWPLYELPASFLFTTGKVTRSASHVRDSTDMKRLMMTVVIALLPWPGHWPKSASLTRLFQGGARCSILGLTWA